MLSDKVVASGQHMLILAREAHFDAISTALWTQKPESFLAHNLDDGRGQNMPLSGCLPGQRKPDCKGKFIALTSGMVPPDLGAFKTRF